MPTIVGSPSTARHGIENVTAPVGRGVRSVAAASRAASASPVVIQNGTRHPVEAPTAPNRAATVSPRLNATPKIPMANPRRLGPANSATHCRPAGKNSPAPAPNRTSATSNWPRPCVVAASTPPRAVATALALTRVVAGQRASARPLTMLNAAIEKASTPKAMPPWPSLRPRSCRVVGNSGDNTCSPTVADR